MVKHSDSSPSDEPAAAPGGDGPDVLVTGASGFIGGHLTRRLNELGHRVRVLIREDSDRSAFGDAADEITLGTLSDPDSVHRAVRGVAQVYNCAGMSADWGRWEDFHRANVDGPKNIVEAAGEAGTVRRVLHLSTTDVYGYPTRPGAEDTPPRDIGLPYNRSKLLGERAVWKAAEDTGVPVTVIRPVTVYGPGSKDFVIEVGNLLVRKQMIYINKGGVPAGLLYVDNAVEAVISAANSGETVGRTYNLRDPELTTWREYVSALASGIGAKPPAINLPASLATAVATVSEKLYGALRVNSRPVLTRHTVHLFNRDQSYAIDRAQRDFGFKSAVDFPEGMRRTIAWLDSAEGRERVPR